MVFFVSCSSSLRTFTDHRTALALRFVVGNTWLALFSPRKLLPASYLLRDLVVTITAPSTAEYFRTLCNGRKSGAVPNALLARKFPSGLIKSGLFEHPLPCLRSFCIEYVFDVAFQFFHNRFP